MPTAAPMTVSMMRSRSNRDGEAGTTSSVETSARGVTNSWASRYWRMMNISAPNWHSAMTSTVCQGCEAEQQDGGQHHKAQDGADDPLDPPAHPVPRAVAHQGHHGCHHGPIVVPESQPVAGPGGQRAGKSRRHEVTEALKPRSVLLCCGAADPGRPGPGRSVAGKDPG